jgi:hypothetical protein
MSVSLFLSGFVYQQIPYFAIEVFAKCFNYGGVKASNFTVVPVLQSLLVYFCFPRYFRNGNTAIFFDALFKEQFRKVVYDGHVYTPVSCLLYCISMLPESQSKYLTVSNLDVEYRCVSNPKQTRPSVHSTRPGKLRTTKEFKAMSSITQSGNVYYSEDGRYLISKHLDGSVLRVSPTSINPPMFKIEYVLKDDSVAWSFDCKCATNHAKAPSQ